MKIIINKKKYKDLKQQSEIDSTGVNSINNSKENGKIEKSKKEILFKNQKRGYKSKKKILNRNLSC